MHHSEVKSFIESLLSDKRIKEFEITRWQENSKDNNHVQPIIKITKVTDADDPFWKTADKIFSQK